MTLSKALCDRIDALRRAALAAEDYEAVLTYHTAEDLTDGMLKGNEAMPAVLALRDAFTHNCAQADNVAAREAWELAEIELCTVFNIED